MRLPLLNEPGLARELAKQAGAFKGHLHEHVQKHADFLLPVIQALIIVSHVCIHERKCIHYVLKEAVTLSNMVVFEVEAVTLSKVVPCVPW